MFPSETLPPQYCEEREQAAAAARKLAEEQKRAAEAAQLRAPVATQHASPGSLAQALQPPLSRPGSSSVLSSIFQNFKRAGTGTPSPSVSMAPSRTQTPVLQTNMEKATVELEAKKRDTDQYPALPGWY